MQDQSLSQDRHFVDVFSLIIGVLVGIARVAIAGQTDTIIDPVVPTQLVETLLTGPQVYNAACHASGVAAPPVFGDSAAWKSRLAQGQHVLEGYQGEAGYMPPKGGSIDLSDQEVLDALDFMLADL